MAEPERSAASGGTRAAPLLAPVAAGLLVVLTIILLRLSVGHPAQPIEWTGLLQGDAARGSAAAYAARLTWFTSAHVLLLGQMAGVLLAGKAIIELCGASGPSARGRLAPFWWILAACLVVGVAVGLYITHDWDARPAKTLIELIERHAGVAEDPGSGLRAAGFVRWLEGSAAGIEFIFVAAFAATLIPVGLSDQDAARLRRSRVWQQRLLYAAAIVLIAAVVQMNLLWSWPAAWADEKAGKAIGELALRVSASWGAIYSGFVLVVFVAARVTLKDHLTRVAERSATAPQQPADWLRQHGLEDGTAQQLGWFVTALGPALAGGPLAALFAALGK